MGYLQTEWLVYFYEADYHNKDDWLHFLKKDFKHCGAIGYDPHKDLWTHLEFTHQGISMEHLSDKDAHNFMAFFHRFKLLRCPVKYQWHNFRIKDVTCVTWIMRLIGFYRWYIFTPYQLYCALIKSGYKSFYKANDKKRKKNPRTDNR